MQGSCRLQCPGRNPYYRGTHGESGGPPPVCHVPVAVVWVVNAEDLWTVRTGERAKLLDAGARSFTAVKSVSKWSLKLALKGCFWPLAATGLIRPRLSRSLASFCSTNNFRRSIRFCFGGNPERSPEPPAVSVVMVVLLVVVVVVVVVVVGGSASTVTEAAFDCSTGAGGIGGGAVRSTDLGRFAARRFFPPSDIRL